MRWDKSEPISTEIFQTTEYDLFGLIPCNRPIYPQHLKRLISAIESNNMLRQHPIRVRPNGMVLDGQHRLMAAQELGIPIYYYIDEDKTDLKDIALESAIRRTWSNADIMNLWVGLKYPHYLTLQGFIDKHPWMTISVAIAVCQGRQSNSYIKGKNREDFIAGKYKITDMAYATKFAAAIGDYMEYINFGKHKKFMQTVSYLIRHPDYDHVRMMAQMDRAGHLLTKQFTKNDYLRAVEKVYNYRRTKKRVRFF